MFSDAELSDASPVALVNEEAARRFWPGRDPTRRPRLRSPIASCDPGQEVWLEIVGIVGNLRNSDIDQGPLPQVFVPPSQQPISDMAVVVKSAGPSALQLVPADPRRSHADRSRPAHSRCRADDAGAVRRSGRHLCAHRAAHGDRAHCPVPLGRRSLWPRVVVRRAARQRDRRTDGARRATWSQSCE